MIPIKDLLNRIKWDKSWNPDEFTIVYLDRILNKGIEIPFNSIKMWYTSFMEITGPTGDADIPLHRIKMVKKNGEVVWQREKIDIATSAEDLDEEKASLFLGVKKSDIRQFEVTTLKGNKLQGWIVQERSNKMGSLLIEKVNDIKTLQYVTGMPKIRYKEETTINLNSCDGIQILEKLDGTNIVFFPLIVDGKVIEVCSKTRLMPLTREKWFHLINEAITKYPQIIEAVEKEKVSISTEMFGYRNLHAINYRELGIEFDMKVHTILDRGKALSSWEVLKIVDKYKLPYVSSIMDKEFIDRYKEYIPEDTNFVELMLLEKNLLYNELENLFELMNKKYLETHQEGTIIIEGSVWHIDKEGETFMLKNKATTIKETHIRIATGIEAIFVHQAINKVYENQPSEIFNDKIKAIELVKEELKEDFPKEVVEDARTLRRMDKMYDEYLGYQKGLEYFREVAKKIDMEIGKDADVSTKLRKFAELYPTLKDKSNTMFRIFSKQV